MRRKHLFLLFVVLLVFCSAAQAQKFRKDDPVWEDNDRQPIRQPAEVDDLSQLADFLENTFSHKPDNPIPRAENVNSLGEVPDSSWFTNRMSRRVLTIEELVKGPNRRKGPDTSQPWVIKGGKTQGITPGFRAHDSKGDLYFIKFDPIGYPQLATSTEVICTKFFHAFGYNVPENYIARIRREDVKIDPDAKITDENGVERKWTEDDVERIFEKVPVADDGTVQVVASFRLEGEIVGPFRYYGTRSDDPNDIFPHENRRELRGLRLFAAWLNHDDSRSVNTKDTFIKQGKLGYVRHHLFDFGSCLGSGSVRIQGRRAGNEYMLEWGPILKAALTFGIWDRSWRYIDYPKHPSIGRFEADYFKPELWRPEYPNPAFERMQNEDAFWACRIIARFTDEMVRALVRTGELKDPAAEEYLAQSLIKRRDKIVRHYLAQMSPLDDFEITSQEGRPAVGFSNLGEISGLGKADSYEYQWAAFENQTGSLKPLGPVEVVAAPAIALPRAGGTGYLAVVIHTLAQSQKGREKPVTVYLAQSPLRVVGVERE
ncbi:MAG: hypothetical protein EHM23_16770 [Acidobacteria bacterium]|nr:MAG: hypothetical protein EHM23_16770 [Acidobacteriota bacterium]